MGPHPRYPGNGLAERCNLAAGSSIGPNINSATRGKRGGAGRIET